MPTRQDHLIHLAVGKRFRRAVEMVGRVTGVQISEVTIRRQTKRIGEAVGAARQPPIQGSRPVGMVPTQMIVSPDGAMLALVGGQ